jgi:hypothetical protein
MGAAPHVWTVEITFGDEGGRTRADARLRAGERELAGWGRSQRNPHDPEVPVVGAELAASRALSDLAHQLVLDALDVVELFEDTDAAAGFPGDRVDRPEAARPAASANGVRPARRRRSGRPAQSPRAATPDVEAVESSGSEGRRP